MANPFARPIRKPMIRPLKGLVAPTAASASSLRKLPTIRVSARLYVSCKRFPRNTGSAKDRINVEGFPFVKSFMSSSLSQRYHSENGKDAHKEGSSFRGTVRSHH